MPSSRTGKTKSLVTMSAQLALAVPQVVAHRLIRLAMASPVPSERDRKEFKLMSEEKAAAFSESLKDMAIEAARANLALTRSFLLPFWLPSLKREPFAVVTQMQTAVLDVLGKGLAPVHRGAVANARRLAHARFR